MPVPAALSERRARLRASPDALGGDKPACRSVRGGGCPGGSPTRRERWCPVSVPLLELREAYKYFPDRSGDRRGTVHAVDGVSIAVAPDETLGIVGESGCGKSTLGRLMVGLHQATSGSVLMRGEPLARPGGPEGRLQMVFQDPSLSLNPRLRVGTSILEPITRGGTPSASARRRAGDLLEAVGLSVSVERRYPHQLSGGQQQRIAIARALAAEPDLVVLDEAVSALDISTQAQVLNLLKDIRDQRGIAYVFISHDLNAVRFLSDRIAVMYLGRVVELASVDSFASAPKHPYSVALRSAVSNVHDAPEVHRVILKGRPPSPLSPPSGCRFHTRCPIAESRCAGVDPHLELLGPGHEVACHLPGAFTGDSGTRS